MQVGIGNMRWYFVLVVTLSSIVIPTWKIFAQGNYRTLHGTIILSTQVNNEPVKYVSDELDVQLDQEHLEGFILDSRPSGDMLIEITNTVLSEN